MVFSFTLERVSELRMLAQKLSEIPQSLEANNIALENVYSSVENLVGPHENEFKEIFSQVKAATFNIEEAVKILVPQMGDTADRIERFIREDLVRDVLDQNVSHQKLPADSRVIWDDVDMKGDSSCKLRDDTELKIHYKSDNNDIVYSGKEFKEHMLDSYGIDSVEYSHREPDFEPFEKPIDAEDFSAFMLERHGRDVAINQLDEGHVSVENMSTSRGGGDGTFAEANSIMAEKLGDNVSKKDVEDYMNSRNLTWHECGDRHTIRIIPSEINQAFSHTGGIGLQKDYDAMTDEINEIVDGRRMVLEKTGIGGDTVVNLEEAINDRHERFAERKHNKK